jgi:uncharacterized protein
MRIAVVGAGISGHTVAHALHGMHELTVFEAGDYAGGHTNTIAVDGPEGPLQVDTGFIVFNDHNYPKFERLLERIGVASQPSNMSFGVSDAKGRFEYAANGINGLYAVRRHLLTPWFQRMIAEVPRFQRACRALLASADPGPSLREWLASERFSDAFIERLIVPQVAAVWSADPDQLSSFPARFLAEFFNNHGMLSLRDRPQWRVIAGGSQQYVKALTAPFKDRIQLNSPIEAITRDPAGVSVKVRGRDAERFDQVVIATHADQALAMLADPSDGEREILGAFPYQPNEVVLHTDTSVMPRRRRAWASWNYHLPEGAGRSSTVTYHMNRLQSLQTSQDYLVTLNMTEAIEEAKIIAKVAYAHPVYSGEGVRAQARYDEIGGRNRTHFAGAYWGWGFHEDGVVSGLRVATALGGSL